MNLLIFVLSFLMIIATISYQALAHYKQNALIRNVWDRYMHIEEPCAFNVIVEEQYKKLKQTKGKAPKEKEEADKKENEGARAASAINFRFLTDPNYPTAYPKETEQMETLIKRLIQLLYGDQPFVRTLQEKRPDFLNELISLLRAASNDEHKITSKNKLVQLSLNDSDMNEFWYQLKRKNPVSLKVIQILAPEELQKLEEIPCLEVSILDYLSNSNVQQLRLYLASRGLLTALLEDPQQVNEVLIKRRELHSEVVKKTMTQEEASKDFQAFAERFDALSPYVAILNYKVTTTNPADYE